MKIIIPIKQVPETDNVRIDEETGTMKREGTKSIVNPLDLYAVETGLQLKEKHGGEIIVITMGPESAEKALREAIAMGCDKGILISGKEFAGSDTWATSYVLSSVINKLGEYDLVLTGERATDGDTGQVGPGIASFLDIPLATYVSNISGIKGKKITVERLIEKGYEIYELPLPALLTVVKEISFPRLPTLTGKKKSRRIEIPVWSSRELEVEEKNLGINGSPTRVVNIEKPRIAREGKMIEIENNIKAGAEAVVDFLKEDKII
ncbi:MAG: electron transfer flavoprotein subunit beta/FixA family protein [Halanaerobiaceae bacterium]